MMPAQVSTLSSSAQNTVSLVLLQISSRGFTFIVNQILLRYLSPTLLGISQQLELFTISILYFSRESLRVALQRQSIEKQQNSAKTNQRTRHKSFDPLSNRLQEVINLSYLPILLGPILATFFAWLYLSKASSESLAISYVRPSLFLFGIAAVIELSVEPCFAFAAHRQLIGLRAAAETVATLSRSIVTVSTAVWASRSSSALGALPFAFGQCAYALGLWVVYYGYDLKGSGARVSLLPTTIGRYLS